MIRHMFVGLGAFVVGALIWLEWWTNPKRGESVEKNAVPFLPTDHEVEKSMTGLHVISTTKKEHER